MLAPKKQYFVVECEECGSFVLAASDKRTRLCPFCGKRIRLKDARVRATSEDAEEAKLILQELKMRGRER